LTEKPAQETVSLKAGVEALVAKVGYKTHTAMDESGTRYKFKAADLCGWWNKWIAGREQTRWTEEELFQLENGTYLVTVEYVSQWQGEPTEYRIDRYEKLEELSQHLLDKLRDEITKETSLKIPLSQIAKDLPL